MPWCCNLAHNSNTLCFVSSRSSRGRFIIVSQPYRIICSVSMSDSLLHVSSSEPSSCDVVVGIVRESCASSGWLVGY